MEIRSCYDSQLTHLFLLHEEGNAFRIRHPVNSSCCCHSPTVPSNTDNQYFKKKIKFGNQKTNTQTNKNPTQLTSFCNGLDFLPGQAHTYKISPFCQQVSCMPFTPIEAKEKTLCMSALLQIFLLSTPAPSLNVLCLGCCFDVASGNFETITWRQH